MVPDDNSSYILNRGEGVREREEGTQSIHVTLIVSHKGEKDGERKVGGRERAPICLTDRVPQGERGRGGWERDCVRKGEREYAVVPVIVSHKGMVQRERKQKGKKRRREGGRERKQKGKRKEAEEGGKEKGRETTGGEEEKGEGES